MVDNFQHWARPPAPFGELCISSGRQKLLATDETITIKNRTFVLTEIDGLAFRAASRVNQASYMVGVAQGAHRCRFGFDAYSRGTEMRDRKREWDSVVQLLGCKAGLRIAENKLNQIYAGGRVTFGSLPATSIEADAEGLRLRRPFMRKIPWHEISYADMRHGSVRVFISSKESSGKLRLKVDMYGWNAVILPEVVALMLREPPPSFNFDAARLSGPF
ncbi:hypothetical protein ABT272_44900 [Streptomyces sp900105245]|uniref:Uncharacterized protein n=1 Tax=Streptomyces sp. 900105245 TaxID=3154379 RepID=A0ABV1ULJ8_9ACTN